MTVATSLSNSKLLGSISDLLNLKKTFSLFLTEQPSNSALRSGQPSSSRSPS
jgi:hypothetical protein